MFCIDNILSGCASLKWKCSHLYTLEYFILFSQVTYTWLSLSLSLYLSLVNNSDTAWRKRKIEWIVERGREFVICCHYLPVATIRLFFSTQTSNICQGVRKQIEFDILSVCICSFCRSFSLIYPFAFCFNFWSVSALRSSVYFIFTFIIFRSFTLKLIVFCRYVFVS